MALKENQYTEAARAMGASDIRILSRHLLPNTLAPVILATIWLGDAIIMRLR